MDFGVSLAMEGGASVKREFEAAALRSLDLTPPLRKVGVHMKQTSIPTNFQVGGRPRRWAGSTRFGQPAADVLMDTGALLRSVGYSVLAQDLILQAGGDQKLKKAALLQLGGDVVPKTAKVLAIPQVGPGKLTRTQARTMGPRDFLDLFPLSEGPEGPGLYRYTGAIAVYTPLYGKSGRRLKRGGKPFKQRAITRVFAFVEGTHHPERPYLVFQVDDVDLALRLIGQHVAGRAGGVP